MNVSPRLVSLALIVTAMATGAYAADDKSFLKKALEGDNSEMALGRLAQTSADSAGVRDFGKMLTEDHAAAKQKALPVAQAHGVRDTSDMAPEATAEVRKLGHLHGPSFDREFTRYMVKDHKKDISDFEKQSRSGDKDTRALAEETLPSLRRHLQTAMQLSGSR